MSKELSKTDRMREMRERQYEERQARARGASSPPQATKPAPAEIKAAVDEVAPNWSLRRDERTPEDAAEPAEDIQQSPSERALGRRARQPLPPAAPGCKRCAELSRRAKAGMEEKRQSEKRASK